MKIVLSSVSQEDNGLSWLRYCKTPGLQFDSIMYLWHLGSVVKIYCGWFVWIIIHMTIKVLVFLLKNRYHYVKIYSVVWVSIPVFYFSVYVIRMNLKIFRVIIWKFDYNTLSILSRNFFLEQQSRNTSSSLHEFRRQYSGDVVRL